MKNHILFLTLLIGLFSTAQVGIGTNDPKGTLDITTINNTGLVLPRVTDIESVTDGNGNSPVDGTTVYDISRNKTCFYLDSRWMCIGKDTSGNPVLIDESSVPFSSEYIKASNTGAGDQFGFFIALSGDGNTLAVSSLLEDSNTTGINGDQTNNTATGSGAVYVFNRTGTSWNIQAYIKGSNTNISDRFGSSIALSGDGNTLVVGAPRESSNATGIGGDQTDNTGGASGAVYVFNRTGTSWNQQQYIKASNTDNFDEFGFFIALSGDGNTLAVSSLREDSNATGIGGDQTDNTASASGAVYVFNRTGTSWNQQQYIKASNTDAGDQFGNTIALSGDGNTLAVGSITEASNVTGIGGNQTDNTAASSGAVYVFNRTGTTWSQQAYIKASNAEANDRFGTSIALSGDGNTLAVGAPRETSNATGIGGDQTDNTASASGAVYVFNRTGTTWNQQEYIKASNTGDSDLFGHSIALSDDGNTLAISSLFEDSNATGIGGDQTDNTASASGAVYVFNRTGTSWNQQEYIKASNTESGDRFGFFIALSSDGNTLAVSSLFEASNATGIGGDQTNNATSMSGATYIIRGY